jgi:iron(III) transport system substrate-binding protein
MKLRYRTLALFTVLTGGVALALPAQAQSLSPLVQKMLSDLKLDAKILDGVDKELAVPQEWLDGARKEAPVIVFDTIRPKEWEQIYAVFSERYPDVKIDHSEVNTSTRRYVLPLTAFKQGRSVADVITGLSGNAALFRQANALEDLSVLPNYKFMPEHARTPDNITVATRIQYWCMSYNTELVKKADLPQTWEDLVNGKRFANKKLMVGNRPNDWVLYLWDMNGDEWGKAYVRKLFDNLRPQLRKESLSAIVKLTALGEGDAAVPQAMARVAEQQRAGSPIGYHCPEPVPFVLTESGLMKNSPRANGAKIFMNWFISREGQIAQYWANKSVPARPELQSAQFLEYPEQISNKQMVKLSPNTGQTAEKLAEFWDKIWQTSGGTGSSQHH